MKEVADSQLANGKSLNRWQDATKYSRIYHVAQSHPRASDENSGTEASPLKTISAAASRVLPGEKVQIQSGIYRETVRPARGGQSPLKMIAYEAGPKQKVILRGSDILKAEHWIEQSPAAKIIDISTYLRSLAQKENLSSEQVSQMPWAKSRLGKLPYSLSPILLFIDGKRIEQYASAKDLLSVSHGFVIDHSTASLLLKNVELNAETNSLIELAFRESLFRPQNPKTSYIRLSGLQFEQAANRFPRPQIGAVSTFMGENWIIEDNLIRQANAICLDIGTGWDWAPAHHSNVGKHIVHNNNIAQCGISGISGHRIESSIISQNFISNIGWHRAERLWETGGIKLHLPQDTLISGNIIQDVTGAPGIWIDYLAENTRITSNKIENVQTLTGAIVVEASQKKNFVDNNIVWNVDGHGVYQRDTDRSQIYNNVFGNVSKFAFFSSVPRKRTVAGRQSTSVFNRLTNNIYYQCKRSSYFSDKNNVAENNIILQSILD
jgi:hypothetical protein